MFYSPFLFSFKGAVFHLHLHECSHGGVCDWAGEAQCSLGRFSFWFPTDFSACGWGLWPAPALERRKLGWDSKIPLAHIGDHQGEVASIFHFAHSNNTSNSDAGMAQDGTRVKLARCLIFINKALMEYSCLS